MLVELMWSKLFGSAVRDVAAGVDPLTASIMHWIGDVQGHVLRRWRSVLDQRLRCGLSSVDLLTGQHLQCPAPAIGRCWICGRPACLAHVMIGQTADLLCGACLADYVRRVRGEQQAAPAAPPEEDESVVRRRHLRTLGLKDPTSWAEINEAFRRRALRWHPDRAKPSKRQQAEAKFKMLNEAHQWLRHRYERAA